MILPDLKIITHKNKKYYYSGMDSPQSALDPTHWKNFPHKVNYNFNSRGFRGYEWPESESELRSSIWCIGDSFTVGLGSPIEHTWPMILRDNIKKPTINVSLDGASNEWITKTCTSVINEVNPEYIIICWSYPERRYNLNLNLEETQNFIISVGYDSIKDKTWPECKSVADFNNLPINIRKEIIEDHTVDAELSVTDDYKIINMIITDEYRRVWASKDTADQDRENLINCIQTVEKNKEKNIIHSFIPNFCNKKYKEQYVKEIATLVKNPIYIQQLDLARDGHHFDIVTSENFVAQILSQIIN